MAEAANQAGTIAYKTNQLQKAQKYFEEASKLNPKEPKYTANLSAVLYEQGAYQACIKATTQAWRSLKALEATNSDDDKSSSPPNSDQFAIKLATRLAKANLRGFYSSADSVYFAGSSKDVKKRLKATLSDVETFVFLARPDDISVNAKVQEMKQVWEQWRVVNAEYTRCGRVQHQEAVESAKKRLRSLGIFKSPSDPTLELFKFGHDIPWSLIRNSVDGKRDVDYMRSRIPMSNGSRETLPWSFLFGGSGDARHVFATIMDAGDFVRLHYADREDRGDDSSAWRSVKTHITLVDIQPATIARTVVMFSILDDIMRLRRLEDKMQRTVLYATLTYLFMSMIMPDYCRQIVMDSAKKLILRLEEGNFCPVFPLYIHPQSVPSILSVLRYWSTPLPKTTHSLLQRNPNDDTRTCVLALNRQDIHPRTASDDGSREFSELRARERSNFGSPDYRNLPRQFRVEDLPPEFVPAYYDAHVEACIYDRTKALLPPQTLLARHPALRHLVSTYGENTTEATWNAAIQEVKETWVPNPTLFDEITTEHPEYGGPEGYPLVLHVPYYRLPSFQNYTTTFYYTPEIITMKTGFGIMGRFFELAADAMHILRKSLTVEVVVGDVILDVSRLLAGDLGKRPSHFPKKYARAWLSNVPDYTNGIINTAVHLTPHLEDGALASMNCLLNLGNFKTINDFCYNYALLEAKDFPRFLGCRVPNGQGPASEDIYLEQLPLPRRTFDLATRGELHAWLARLLVCTLCNGRPKPMNGWVIRLPNNLSALLHILIHLHRVGFPAHWIGDFLQFLIDDNLVTDAVPYTGLLPIPSSESMNKKAAPRKINLAPWAAELQTLIASVRLALPFSLVLPAGWPTRAEEICTYKTIVKHDDRLINLTQEMQTLSLPFIMSIALLFYLPSNTRSGDKVVYDDMSALLEGNGDWSSFPSHSLQILLAQESVDLRSGEIIWRLSERWYEKMKQEGWQMVVYRTDMNMVVTDPVKATKWSLFDQTRL